MSNYIRAQVTENEYEEYRVLITMMLDGRDATWIEFDEEQLTNLIALLKSQRKILRKCLK